MSKDKAELKALNEQLEVNHKDAVDGYKKALRESIPDRDTAEEAVVALDELLKVARQLGPSETV